MYISKHHYAIELAKSGNTVYFLNPPGDPQLHEPVKLIPSGIHPNLYLIEHRIFFPYWLKFHGLWLFHLLMKWQIRSIEKILPKTPDIIWSFDIGNLYPLRYFSGRAIKVFHPVDEPSDIEAIKAGEGADIIFSVSNEILEKYAYLKVPEYFINHGISKDFLDKQNTSTANGIHKHVGISGNLLRPDIDKEILLSIVKDNQEIIFDIWGSYENSQSNIGGADAGTGYLDFINSLKKAGNVRLHGPVPVHQLAKNLGEVDAFLICYDVQKDQSKGTNYHKIMEFLSTGKVIISNNVTTYYNRPDLIQMIEDRSSNDSLPLLFKNVMEHIEEHNSVEKMKARQEFAKNNSYTKQLERIDQVLFKEIKVGF